MRSFVTLWDAVSDTKTYISPERAYPAAGLAYLNLNPPSIAWMGASNLPLTFVMPQIRTVYLYISEALSGSVNIKIYGTGVVASSTEPYLYPYPAENIEETIAVQSAGAYESANMYKEIHKIEILGALTAADPEETALLSVGLGSKGFTNYFTADTNSSSPMHYTLQVETESEEEGFTHQGFVSARNPVTYIPNPPVGIYFPEYLYGWDMYAPVSTPVILSSINNFTASVADGIVGALAPISVLWLYIDDPAIFEEAPSGQTSKAYITFLQQGTHA